MSAMLQKHRKALFIYRRAVLKEKNKVNKVIPPFIIDFIENCTEVLLKVMKEIINRHEGN
jgi:hypothetical protein